MGPIAITPSSPVSESIAGHRGEQRPQLSPASLKLRDRFRDFTGHSRVIIHELGHAVVAAHLGHPLEKVTIEADGILGGACLYRREELGTNRFTANQAVVSIAAKAAIVRALDGYNLSDLEYDCSTGVYQDEFGIDRRNLQHCARLLNIPKAAYDHWVEGLAQDAWEILSSPHVWTALKRLAKELKRERTLTGARVSEVLAECKEEAEASA